MFITELKKLSKDCNFGTLRDSLIQDGVVCGILNIKIRKDLSRETNLDLAKCIAICKARELTDAQSKCISDEAGVSRIKKDPLKS